MRAPYQLICAVSVEDRHMQMEECLKHNLPRLAQLPVEDNASISIACYGPSLADTWQEISHPIISMSGATRYLADRGVIADYHVEIDPREQKVKHLQPPVDGVHYLMASVCHPSTWQVLKNQKVSIWHVRSAETTEPWVFANDPSGLLLQTGSTVGMAAIHIGGCLGYRHFEIHGMDGNIRDGKRHAGPHYGHLQGGITWDAGRVTYQTSRIMSNACAEVINTFRLFPIFGVFHGQGLQQALIDEEYDLDNVALAGTPNASLVRKARAVFFEQQAA